MTNGDGAQRTALHAAADADRGALYKVKDRARVRWRVTIVAGGTLLGAVGVPLQAQQLGAIRTFGGPGLDVGNSIVRVPDWGYIVVGMDGRSGSERDAWVVRLDERLETPWTRRYGGQGQDHAWDVAATDQGTFLVAGFQETPDGDEDVWVLHLDAEGSVIWERTYGGPRDEKAWAVVIVPGGEALILAETESFGQGAEDVYLIRVDMRGDTVWTRHAGWHGMDRALSMTRRGEGALFVGMSDSAGGARRMLVGEVSAAGDVRLDLLPPGGEGDEIAHGVAPLPEGGFLVTGYGTIDGGRSNDVLLLRLDDDGRETGRSVVQSPGDERAMMSAIAAAGAIGTVGYVQRNGDWDVMLLLGTAEEPATVTWTHTSPGTDRGVMAIPAGDGGWIVTGTLAVGADPGQLLVMRIDPS